MEAPTLDTAPGLDFLYGNVPIPFFNVAVLHAPVAGQADLGERLKRAQAFAASRPYPWFLIAADDATPGELAAHRDAALAAAGLVPAMKLTGMICDELTQAPDAPGLDLRPATSPADYTAIGEINAVAYEMGSGAGVGTMDRPGLFEGGHAILGRQAGNPVSCALTTPLDGRLYAAFVATLPTHRRQGLAEACLRESLNQARAATGLTRSVLHATDAGRPIYARMGYRPVATYTLFGQAH